ncbi:slipin family protein [Luteipulveratus halotolerans]|uniref:Band 7 domain-containing protein n=1 Tax=Luteipulveratus halotolerans TaxID=1631356 RepID=A0A0L6CND1_9MICO|nr:slipin family protein [Luteipulveratus halotolerans]KNX39028.1 hypothetical protein VV01_20870 [Luteipulveratus halotolerans]
MSLFHTTVPTRHACLVYKNGALVTVLGSGRHRRVRKAEHVAVDLREQMFTTATQEVPTSDGLSVRATVAVRWAVADPVRFHEVSTDPVGTIYLAAQVALREQIAHLTLDQVVERGASAPTTGLTEAVAAVADRVGVVVPEVIVKDVLLPAEIRAAATDLVAAKQRGQARLEEARAETAALRSLANGAQLLDKHPALAQLRLVQALPPGARVSLQVGDADAGDD